MMLRKNDLPLKVELGLNVILHPKLLFDPKGHGLQKGRDPVRRVCEIGFEDAFEFEEGFIVERDNIKTGGLDAAFSEAKIDCIFWERKIMLLTREAFFLRRRDDLSVLDKTRRAVMIKSRYAKNVHGVLRTDLNAG